MEMFIELVYKIILQNLSYISHIVDNLNLVNSPDFQFFSVIPFYSIKNHY